MTKHIGSLLGVLVAAIPPRQVPTQLKAGFDQVLARDTLELVTAFAQNDTISLGYIRADAILNPVTSVIAFDDLGTSVTMDIGYAGAENALVAAQDVSAAAGQISLLKSVDIANWFKPLWQQLGMAAPPASGVIELLAKLEGADPGTGTVSWQIMGQPH